jgi:hypothetical protein
LSLTLDVLDKWLLPVIEQVSAHLLALHRMESRANGPEVQRLTDARNAVRALDARYEELRRLAFWLYQGDAPTSPAASPAATHAVPRRSTKAKRRRSTPARRAS